MKLTYIANIRLPTEKAHGIQIMKMCEAFASEGLEVELFVSNRKTSILDDSYSYYGVKKNFKIRRIFCFDLIVFGKLGFLLQSLSFTFFAVFKCLFQEKSTIYTRDLLPACLLTFLGRKVVWEGHRGEYNFLIKYLIEKRTKFVVISGGLKDLYVSLALPNEKILVAHDGVDLEDFSTTLTKNESRKKLGLPLDKKLVMYTGHLYGWKGAHLLAETAKLFNNETNFIFVGGTDSDLVQFRKKYGLINNIDIVGRVAHSDIPMYLNSSDILVLPNSGREDISRLYTSPLKLFEYMASGVPQIVSDLPSLRDVVDESTAYFFTPDSAESLASVVEHVLVDPQAFEKSKKAQIVVKDYSWEKRAQAIVRFIV